MRVKCPSLLDLVLYTCLIRNGALYSHNPSMLDPAISFLSPNHPSFTVKSGIMSLFQLIPLQRLLDTHNCALPINPASRVEWGEMGQKTYIRFLNYSFFIHDAVLCMQDKVPPNIGTHNVDLWYYRHGTKYGQHKIPVPFLPGGVKWDTHWGEMGQQY